VSGPHHGDSRRRFRSELAEAEKEPLTEDERAALGFPHTCLPTADPGATQRLVFDPSTKQYSSSFRASEPQFAKPAQATGWREARRAAIDTVLAAISDSEWADHLVLRGSVLLKSWLGDVAREPGDLDFVVVPRNWKLADWRTAPMITGVAAAAQRACAGLGIEIIAGQAVTEDIWTYERAPGRRLMLPWAAIGGHRGYLQLDFVFGESLPEEPGPALIGLSGDDRQALVLAVSMELSLAWKVQWLVTDMWPQAKDLYDAVLLAERTPLRYDLLQRAVGDADPYYERNPVTLANILELAPDIKAFRADYPDLHFDDRDLVLRLAAALDGTFTPGG
jgi:hypothetical protein